MPVAGQHRAEALISDTGAITQQDRPGTEYLHISMVHLDADAYACSALSTQYSIPPARALTQYGVGTVTDGATMLPLTNSAGRFITFFDWQLQSPGQAMLKQTIPAIVIAFLIAGIIASILLLDQLWATNRAPCSKPVGAKRRAPGAARSADRACPTARSFEAALSAHPRRSGPRATAASAS